jgi:hypothetical protein
MNFQWKRTLYIVISVGWLAFVKIVLYYNNELKANKYAK